MSLNDINKFCREIKTHWKEPETKIKYTRLIKELKEPYRKILLNAIQHPESDQLTDADLQSLNQELRRILPIVETDETYAASSQRKKGLVKWINRIFSNQFERTRSSDLLDAIKKHNPPLEIASQKHLIPKSLFIELSHLPTRKIKKFEYTTEIPSLIKNDPIVMLSEKNHSLFLGLNLNVVHLPSSGIPKKAPCKADLLIRLNSFAVWTTSSALDYFIKAFQTKGRCATLPKKLKDLFLRCEKQDDPELIKNHCHYDARWLIVRFAAGKNVQLRDPASKAYFDAADPACKNYGYLELSLSH